MNETLNESKKTPKNNSLKAQRERDEKMVRGRFRYFEVPGGEMTFSFRKYKGEETKTYHLRDGEVYTIPYAVAVHLNQDCSYIEHVHAVDENGKPSVKIGRKIPRCGFESLEFDPDVDLKDNRSTLYVPES